MVEDLIQDQQIYFKGDNSLPILLCLLAKYLSIIQTAAWTLSISELTSQWQLCTVSHLRVKDSESEAFHLIFLQIQSINQVAATPAQ